MIEYEKLLIILGFALIAATITEIIRRKEKRAKVIIEETKDSVRVIGKNVGDADKAIRLIACHILSVHDNCKDCNLQTLLNEIVKVLKELKNN